MPEPLRITQTHALILDLLSREGDSYGLELVRASEGRLKRGSVYVLLDRMEKKGLIESWEEEPPPGHRGPARRKYKPTGTGSASLEHYLRQITSSFGGLRLAGCLAFVGVGGAVEAVVDGLLGVAAAMVHLLLLGLPVTGPLLALFCLASLLLRSKAGVRFIERLVEDIQKEQRERLVREVAAFVASEGPLADARQMAVRGPADPEWEVHPELQSLREFLRDAGERLFDEGKQEAGSGEESSGSPLQGKEEADPAEPRMGAALAAAEHPPEERPEGRAPRARSLFQRSPVHTPPGSTLMEITRFVFPRRWVERRLEQVYADELVEYHEDLQAGRTVRAGWVRVRIALFITWVVALSVVGAVWDGVVGSVLEAFRSAD
jgi:DNA-binding PadR family transcriptional regulator